MSHNVIPQSAKVSSLFNTSNPPAAAAWTTFNVLDGFAITDHSVFGTVFARNGNLGSEQLSGGYVSISNATTFTLEAGFVVEQAFANAGQSNAIALSFSDGTKYVTLGVTKTAGANPGIYVIDWTDATAISAVAFSTASIPSITDVYSSVIYFQIKSNGSTITYSVSKDGYNWLQVFSRAIGTFITGTITRAAIAIDAFDGGSTDVPVTARCVHFKNTNP